LPLHGSSCQHIDEIAVGDRTFRAGSDQPESTEFGTAGAGIARRQRAAAETPGKTLGRRGHTGDPLYGIRRIARTRLQLLSTRQYARLTEVLDGDEHLAVKVAYVIYQKIIAAYADANRRRGKKALTRLIESIRRGVPTGLEEIAQLGRTLSRRRADILAFFDHHASNGPTEAINGRLEALRRNALGFRNLTNYRWRSTPA